MAKIFFHILNCIILILYLFPGSILGFLLFEDLNKQPQIYSSDFISINHVLAFFILSLLGLYNFESKNKKKIYFYLIFASVFLELSHLIIPQRGFQLSDLFGNILGLIISIIIFYSLKNWRAK